MTGNTEKTAHALAEELTRLGDRVEVKDAFMVEVEELLSYGRILIGSYTWGDGELPDEALDFFEDLKEMDLTGVYGAVFGMGDSTYQHFALAVDIWEHALVEQGCHLIVNGLKIDINMEKEIKVKCREFCRRLKETTPVLAN